MPADPGLFQLVYMSRRSLGVSDDEVVDEIVLPSIAKNRRLDVTGCIWFDNTRFLEVLEGPEAVVRSLFEKISDDPRHTDLELLAQHAVPSRRFDRFNMRSCTGAMPESLTTLLQTAARPGWTADSEPEAIVLVVRRVVDDLSGAGSDSLA